MSYDNTIAPNERLTAWASSISTDMRAVLALSFNEWQRRYIANPDEFEREFESVQRFCAFVDAGRTPDYGETCAAYLCSLMPEVAGDPPPVPPASHDLRAAVADAVAQIRQVTARLGAPGDYGYGTPAGDALYALAKLDLLLAGALDDAKGGDR